MNYKRKVLVILIISILLSIIGGVIVFAYNENKLNKNSILTYEKISSIENTYKEISDTTQLSKIKSNLSNSYLQTKPYRKF